MTMSPTAPRQLQLAPGPVSRCRAIQALLRPGEGAPGAPSLQSTPAHALALEVARWLREQLLCGALRHLASPEGPLHTWHAPEATLERGGGDTDDLAILAASLLHAGEVRAHVVLGTRETHGVRAPHTWVEGVDPLGSFLLEPTTGEFHRLLRPARYRAGLVLEARARA